MSLKKTMVSFLALCVSVTSAFASSSSTKVKNFQSAGGGVTLNARVDGMAMFKPQGSVTLLHLHMDNLQRNTWYGVALATFADSSTLVFNNNHAFQTNGGGDGSFDATLNALQDPGADPIVYVYAWDGVGTDVSFDELRAVGWIDPSFSPTVKIKDFDPAGGGAALNPYVDGMAVIKYDPLALVSSVHIHMRDLHPNTIYGVGIVGTNSGDLDYSDPGFDPINMIVSAGGGLQTDCEGHGTYDVSLLTQYFGPNPTIYLYVWNGVSDYSTLGDGGVTFGITPSEFRATGTVDDDSGCHH